MMRWIFQLVTLSEELSHSVTSDAFKGQTGCPLFPESELLILNLSLCRRLCLSNRGTQMVKTQRCESLSVTRQRYHFCAFSSHGHTHLTTPVDLGATLNIICRDVVISFQGRMQPPPRLIFTGIVLPHNMVRWGDTLWNMWSQCIAVSREPLFPLSSSSAKPVLRSSYIL